MATNWKTDYLRYKDFFLNVLSMYNSKPNLKIYLELIMSIVTVIVFSTFAIRPTVLTIIELNKEIKGKEETVVKLKQKIRNLQTISDLMQNESENIKYIDQVVPKTASVDILIKQVEQLAIQNSIQILGFSSSDVTLFGKDDEVKKRKEVEALSGNPNELPFTFSATGSYQNIATFINTIENLRRPIKFDSFTINSNTTDQGKILVVTIAGRVPYLLE